MEDQALQGESVETEIDLMQNSKPFRILVEALYNFLSRSIGTTEEMGRWEALAWAEALRQLLDELEDYNESARYANLGE